MRIKIVHLNEWDDRTQGTDLSTFRTLFDGTTSSPALISDLERIGYERYLTIDRFHPCEHHPDVLIYQTSDALDRMLGTEALTGVAPWMAWCHGRYHDHDIDLPVHSRGVEPRSSAVRWRGKCFGS